MKSAKELLATIAGMSDAEVRVLFVKMLMNTDWNQNLNSGMLSFFGSNDGIDYMIKNMWENSAKKHRDFVLCVRECRATGGRSLLESKKHVEKLLSVSSKNLNNE